MSKFFVLIPAAGSSQRMGDGRLKPFIELNGKSILERTLEPFLKIKDIEKIVVLANPDSLPEFQKLVGENDPRVVIIPGGKTRQQSVCAGLEFLKKEIEDTSDSYVLIHDAARCMISADLIESVKKEVVEKKVVTLAIPLTDSLLQLESGSSKAARSLDRGSVIAVQTPQAFSFDLIFERHMHFKHESIWDFTDDCALLEGIHDVYIVPGAKSNIKITTREDLVFVTALLSNTEL